MVMGEKSYKFFVVSGTRVPSRISDEMVYL